MYHSEYCTGMATGTTRQLQSVTAHYTAVCVVQMACSSHAGGCVHLLYPGGQRERAIVEARFAAVSKHEWERLWIDFKFRCVQVLPRP